jgi:CO/xanthine dehydrogenase Mo-binding subunit
MDHDLAPPTKFGIDQPVRRFEDSRLLTGRGRFQDDVALPGQTYAVFVRSPHAHARIDGIDTSAARAAPGVLAVYTGQDYAADGLGMPRANMPRADTMCAITIRSNPAPTPSNPLGAKGAGEAGCVGALPSVMIAIMHALEPAGVTELDMPATSARVWQALWEAGR